MFFPSVNFFGLTPVLTEIRKSNIKAIIIIGMGNKGAGIFLPEQILKIFETPILNLPIIDTNGAGDSLAMGFLASYVFWNKSIFDSLLIGQILARYTCSLKSLRTILVSKESLLSQFEIIKKDFFNKYD